MFTKRRSLWKWPAMRSLPGGEFRISGQCYTLLPWLALKRVCIGLIFVAGIALLAAACTEIINGLLLRYLGASEHARPLFEVLGAIRTGGENSLSFLVPKPFGYRPGMPVDWWLAGIGATLLLLRRPLSFIVVPLVSAMLKPLLGRRFRITIGAGHVTLHRGMFTKRIERGSSQDAISIRVVPTVEYYPTYGQEEKSVILEMTMGHPSAVVELVRGVQRLPILYAQRQDEAEAIAARCIQALTATNQTAAHWPEAL